MPSLQKIKSKRQKSSGRGASPKYLWQKQIELADRRTTLRLGLLSNSAAAEISGFIDKLIEAKRYGLPIPAEAQAWLQTAEPKLRKRLVSLGLCPELQNPFVADCFQAYIERRSVDWKPKTIENFNQVAGILREHFEDVRVGELNAARVKAFWKWMRSKRAKPLGENTCRKHFQRCRQAFDDAVEQEIVVRNPFRIREIKVSVGVAEKAYVTESSIQAVIDHLPRDKVEWKLLFAFVLYVGCRMPSEIRELTWNDIDWAANTILIRSPKTGDRRVPIFPEIQSLLLQQGSAVPDGTVYVFPNLRMHTNLGTVAKRYAAAAGVETWPEFWNSLRASRETDLMDSYGLRRACAWIGNSPTIAMKHYSLMKKSDYIDAGNAGQKSDAKSDAEWSRNTENGEEPESEDQGKLCVCGSQETESAPKRNRTSS